MATEPQKTELKILFNGSIDSNLSSIVNSESKLKEIQPVIDTFDPTCKGLDREIVSIAANINTLKSEIVTLHSNAYAVGCGTTVGVTTVFPDTVVDSSFNLSSSTYDSDDPYEITNITLTTSNVGFGTFVIYTPSNNQVSGLGSAYADIGSCYGGGCISGNCTNFANQITAKQNQIISLQSQLNDLTSASNSIRTERVDYQVIRWADKYSIRTLKEENQRIRIALDVLDDARYDPYI
jgi:prefoldin subunit 5